MAKKKAYWLRIEELLENLSINLIGENILRATVNLNSASPSVLFSVPAGSTMVLAVANVLTVWDAAASMDVGYAGATDSIFDGIDLTVQGPTANATPMLFTTETEILLTIDHGVATEGEAEVIIQFV